jgi:hypothetical protein
MCCLSGLAPECHPEAAAEGSVPPVTAGERILRFAQDDKGLFGCASSDPLATVARSPSGRAGAMPRRGLTAKLTLLVPPMWA